MTQIVRLAGGKAAEIIPPHPSGAPIEQCFPPELVAMLVVVSDDVAVAIGDLWDGTAFSPPPPPEPEAVPVPASISATQFWLELPNWIAVTEEEALAGASTGAIPGAIATVLAPLPSAAAFEAKVRLARMGDVLRADPLTEVIATGLGKTPEELDAFFRAAALR